MESNERHTVMCRSFFSFRGGGIQLSPLFIYEDKSILIYTMENKKNTWKDLSVREKYAYGISAAAFFLGWMLTIICFFVDPIGSVTDSVLWILGQVLLFTGSVIGISEHYSSQLKQFKDEIRKEIEHKEENSD